MAQAQNTSLNYWPSTPHTPSRQLCSASDTGLLWIPSFKAKTNGQRYFSFQAATVWNNLPQTVKTFHTYLLIQVFSKNTAGQQVNEKQLVLLCSLPLDHCCLWLSELLKIFHSIALWAFFYVKWLCYLTVLEFASRCVRWIGWYSWIMVDVNIDCICDYLFFFVLCQNVRYHCTALSTVFNWICTF